MIVAYDFECRLCDFIFEARVEAGTKVVSCPNCMDSLADQIWLSCPGMKPDDFWGGFGRDQAQIREMGINTNSRSEAERIMKERGIEPWDRGCFRDARRNMKYKREKQEKERHDFIERMVLDEDFQKENIHKVKEGEEKI